MKYMTYIALPISVKLHTQEWESSLWHFHSWKKMSLIRIARKCWYVKL